VDNTPILSCHSSNVTYPNRTAVAGHFRSCRPCVRRVCPYAPSRWSRPAGAGRFREKPASDKMMFRFVQPWSRYLSHMLTFVYSKIRAFSRTKMFMFVVAATSICQRGFTRDRAFHSLYNIVQSSGAFNDRTVFKRLTVRSV